MKGIPTHFLKLKQKMDSTASTIKRMNFANFLVLVETVDVHYPIIFSILVAGIGIPLNTTAQNKFPLFLPFVFALYLRLRTIRLEKFKSFLQISLTLSYIPQGNIRFLLHVKNMNV